MKIVKFVRMKHTLKTLDIEIAVANYINPRVNLIVPNISWGMSLHECDLLVITKAGYAWEIEIKVTKADLINDIKKRHGHHSPKIKNLYFAIPDYLTPYIERIPDRAGVLIVNKRHRCKEIRRPKSNKNAYKFSDKERYNVARLGSMRIWGLKRKLQRFGKGEIRGE